MNRAMKKPLSGRPGLVSGDTSFVAGQASAAQVKVRKAADIAHLREMPCV
ncbi:hypothetical protein [Actinomadura terrae]|nr:hypothetical protein [Actinomadura terrae]